MQIKQIVIKKGSKRITLDVIRHRPFNLNGIRREHYFVRWAGRIRCFPASQVEQAIEG